MEVDAWLQHTRVRNVWPLRSLPLPDSPFDIGGGPCAKAASRVVSMELVEIVGNFWGENAHAPRRVYVHFYDLWADHVQHFVQHFMVGLSGRGVIQLEAESESLGDLDADSPQIVVADRSLLDHCDLTGQWTSDAMEIELKYRAATRENSSRPIVYGPVQVLTSTTIAAAAMPTAAQKKKPNERGLRGVGESKIVFYSSLVNISSQGNIYGVVTSYTKPKLSGSGRRDYVMTVSLIDESRPLRQQAYYVNVFAATVEMLPKIVFIGDILRVHKLVLNKYEDHDVGTSSSTVSTNVVIRAGADDSLTVLHSQATCTFTSSDYDRCQALIKWSRETLATDTTLPPRNTRGYIHLANCKSLVTGDVVDVVAKVVKMSQDDATFDSGLLSVSDGYDDETCIPLRVHEEWSMLTSLGLLPAVESHWCKFRAVELELQDDGATMTLHFRAKSSLEILPDNIYEVRHALERSDPLKAKRSTTGVQPMSALCPAMSLVELLLLQPPQLAQCTAQVIDVWVSDAPHSMPTSTALGYTCVLRLQDSTASIDAILHGNNAQTFFGTLAASDHAMVSKAHLTKRLTALTHYNTIHKWCLCTYLVGDSELRVAVVNTVWQESS
ncbi:hypothetical protein, variant 1 [Aphanomyces invadans]|uniref:Telomeric single stranded DNA binding POT1/Cdc13 domain-containing protein n=1 Tax=Aphanomyces invadans TaxID=157072 RepID=A0A024U6I7_9STRA|nr:hypothetical protein, variant 1 [Aphanomyces invadans]ETW02031.1 hypothetical protein, variant 1 [Aphanomyces invadans]|eukprot:XP_008869879.1 hypothetical protein, variant 1 [Aphanomyces invadans]